MSGFLPRTTSFCISRPERRHYLLARPEGHNFRLVGPVGHNLCVEAKGPNNGRALRDAPCTVMPHPASLDELDSNSWRVGQLALLKQGPPIHKSVHSWGRSAGIDQCRRKKGKNLSNSLHSNSACQRVGFGPATRLHPRQNNSKGRLRGAVMQRIE